MALAAVEPGGVHARARCDTHLAADLEVGLPAGAPRAQRRLGLAADGVTVNCLAPGRIATDRVAEFDQARAKREGTTEEQAKKASLVTIPAGRYGEADEFAALATFIASPKASYMTGGIIRIDGGMIRSV